MRTARSLHRSPAGRAPLDSVPPSIPAPPPSPFATTTVFCQDLAPPRSPHRHAPPRLSATRGRAARAIATWWDAYKTVSAAITTALLLCLMGLAIYKHAPVANPPQAPTGRHSPYPHPGSPFAVAEFE